MQRTILLIDDDSAFRSAVKDILEVEEYAVIEHSDGKEVLDYTGWDDIHLVLTDVLMPDVDGVVLAMEIRKKRPGLKIVGMTGGGDLLNSRKTVEMCGTEIFDEMITKPFESEELLSIIAALIS